jgi:hypothetical protein
MLRQILVFTPRRKLNTKTLFRLPIRKIGINLADK